MAKKRSAKKGRRAADVTPAWIRKLTAGELARLKRLVPIAQDVETCEMPPLSVKRLRGGPKKGLWIVGRLDDRKKAR